MSADEKKMRGKKEARSESRAGIALLSPEEKERRSRRIVRYLSEEGLPENTEAVFGYRPLPDEPDLRPLWDRIFSVYSLPFYLPRIEGKKLIFVRVSRTEALRSGAGGLSPPESGIPHHRLGSLERVLLLVPGLGFRRGEGAGWYRLGRGGGYYDRFLAEPVRPLRTWGIGFALPEIEFPADEWDQKLERVCTDAGFVAPVF